MIGIDEAQFFPDLASFCIEMANMGKIVYVAALSGTFDRKSFPEVAKLFPQFDKIIGCNAVCVRCHDNASTSHRKSDNTAEVVSGGADKYEDICRTCYNFANNIS